MEEVFHQSTKLQKQTLRPLLRRKNNPALVRMIFMFMLLLVMSFLVVYTWNGSWPALVLSHIGFGVICCSVFAALHESGHNTAFKSKNLNQWAAMLTGIGHIYPASLFRELHFTHHRHTHVPGLDPEISLGSRQIPPVTDNPFTYIFWLTGIPLLSFKIMMIVSGAIGMPELLRKNFFPFVRPKMRLRIALECFVTLMVYGALLVLALNYYPGFWGLFSGQVVGHSLLASYLVMEHNGLPHEGDILNKTRSIRTNKFIKLLMWNMPYHAEHHAYPGVPFHALPELHKALDEEIKHKNEGHPDFHYKTLNKLLLGISKNS